jgi:hypothetical protein
MANEVIPPRRLDHDEQYGSVERTRPVVPPYIGTPSFDLNVDKRQQVNDSLTVANWVPACSPTFV